MAKCSKDYEIELESGRTIECTVHVEGYFEEDFGADADGNRGTDQWFIDSWESEHDESLTKEEQAEFDEKIEEKVFAETWDFEGADEDEDADRDEDFED